MKTNGLAFCALVVTVLAGCGNRQESMIKVAFRDCVHSGAQSITFDKHVDGYDFYKVQSGKGSHDVRLYGSNDTVIVDGRRYAVNGDKSVCE